MSQNPASNSPLIEKAFLVFVNDDESEDEYTEQELAGLCEAAQVGIAGSIRQRVGRPTTASYIGSGKLKELAVNLVDAGADFAIFDCELTGIQARNIQDEIKRPVIDRTQLILDIFAQRARTKEGQLQVELAQLSYMMPRLMSVYTKFERQKGGIGLRGPGETKLETDRRMIRDRISRLKGQIEEVKQHRDHQRQTRRKNPYPFAAIVGYTSAGKSTLMNRLCQTDLLADAMPFATLDPTTRKLDLPDGYALFLTDTVGFIRNLPTHLVAAFRSTLEEVTSADIVLHVVDISIPEWDRQRDAVLETLQVLDAQNKPTLTVFNKVDLAREQAGTDGGLVQGELEKLLAEWPNSVAISAQTGEGVPELLARIKDMCQGFLLPVVLAVPYAESHLVEECYRSGRVLSAEYQESAVLIRAEVSQKLHNKLQQYAVASQE
jgi:GTP-binding protein HflX